MPWLFRRPDSPNWQIGYMVDGEEERVSTRTSSQKAAERILSKLTVEIAEGRFLDKRLDSDWTLATLGRVYLDRMKVSRPRSDRWRRERWAVVERALGPETPLEAIDQERIDRAAEDRLKAGLAVSTVKGEVFVVQHALRMAWRWRKETGLSALKIDRWTPPRDGPAEEPEAYTTAEAKAIEATARRLARHHSAEVREGALLAWLFLKTGGRPVELYAATVRNLEPTSLRLPGFKRGRWRTVPVPAALGAALGRFGRGRETIFPASSARPQERYKEAWGRIRAETGVAGAFYQIRHTFAAEFLRRGGDMRDLQYLMGHRSITTTEKYARFSPDYELRGRVRASVQDSVRSGAARRGVLRAKPSKKPSKTRRSAASA